MTRSILHATLVSETIRDDRFEVTRVVGRETLGQPYTFDIEIVGGVGIVLDEEALLGEPATLLLSEGGVPKRRVHGVVQRIDSALASETGHVAWTIALAPRISSLALTTATEVAMDMSVPDIVAERLQRAGLRQGDDYDLGTLSAYPAREFVVQFKESDLAFLSRLCEHVGITLYFRQDEARDVVAFSDEASGFATEHADLRIPFRARGERQDVFDLRTTRRVEAARVVVKDYNYRTPGVALQADAIASGKSGQRFEYGSHFKTPAEAERIAKIRAEELAWQSHVYIARSARPELSPGTRFRLEGHPLGDRELLVVEVEHELTQAAGLFAGPTGDGCYENRFRAIDAAVPFRPPRTTPKPHVAGVLTGIVEAAQPGQYAEVDQDGRYHVRFLFDTGAAPRGKASRPIRMAQPHAGPGYGFHFPLRDGVEVVLACVEGDPDRPIIAGAVPNPTMPSTVAAGNAKRNVIRTGGGTEINIDDHEDGERLKISVPFGNTVVQLGAPNAPTQGIYMGTDKKIHVASSEGMSFVDSTEITGAAPDIAWRAENSATMLGRATVQIGSEGSAHIIAPVVETLASEVNREQAAVITNNASGVWSAQAGSTAVLTAGASATVQAPTVGVQGTLITIRASGVVEVSAATVNVTAPNVNVSGNVKVTGGVVDIQGGPIKLNV